MNKYLTSFNYDNITFTYTEYCCKLIKASRKIWKKTIDYKNMVKKKIILYIYCGFHFINIITGNVFYRGILDKEALSKYSLAFSIKL